MQATYISELAEGGRANGTYFLRSRELRATRAGEAFLALEFGDRSGVIPGVLFRPSPIATAVPAGSAVRVRGTVTRFRGTKRISVEEMRPAESWNPADLIGASVRPREELVAEFGALARSVTHKGLRKTIRQVFRDPQFFERFCDCPASQSYHHAHLSGLLEHTVSVASICDQLAGRYDGVDRDLLVTAALVHDIGKVDELAFDTGIGYTDEGRLVGHVVAGDTRVRDAARRTGLETGVLLKLEHAILSHHGELEWGSPKRPATFEALLLHHVDNLDAKAAGFSAALRGALLIEENWTDSGNLFRRPLYAPKPVEDDRPGCAAEDAQHFRVSA